VRLVLQDDVAWLHLETASTFYLTTPSLVYFDVRAAEASKLSTCWGGNGKRDGCTQAHARAHAKAHTRT